MERKNEIAAKKAKLAELRRQREEREQRQKTLTKGGPATEDVSEVRLFQRTSTEALTLTSEGSPAFSIPDKGSAGARQLHYKFGWGGKTCLHSS